MFLSVRKQIFRSVLIVALVLVAFVGSSVFVPTTHAAAAYGSPTDTNIKYIGRWSTSSSIVHSSYWPGAYLKTNFTGRTVKIKLAGSVNIYVSIDHKADVFFANVKGTVNLTPTALASGTHSLRVAAFTEHDDIQFQGLILDSGARTSAPTISSQLIEFVGDSITAGAQTSKRALTDYAWLVGEQLGVEHTQIAQGGICLVTTTLCPQGVGMSDQFFKMQTIYFPNSPAWNFATYQPKVVVINLGTNDGGYKVTDAAFQSTLITFLHNMRAKYPLAQIYALRTFSGRKAAVTLSAIRSINAAGDRSMHYIDTTGWLTTGDFADSVHPNDAGQQKVANRLQPFLVTALAK